MELVKVAFRNIFRNKRRSILNMIALVISISIMVLGLGWVAGYDTYVFGSIINFQTGHIQILDSAYMEEERRLPLDIYIDGPEEIEKRIKELDGVAAAAGRINFSMELSNGRDSVRMLGRAVEPEKEAEITKIIKYIQSGEYLDSGPGILLGAGIAEKLGIAPGDTVFVTAMDRYSVKNFTDMKVRGLFSFGYPKMDDNIVFMDMESARSFLSMEGLATKVVVKLNEDAPIEEFIQKIQNRLSKEGSLTAYSWEHFSEAAVSAVKSDTYTFWIVLVILYLLIILGILNSMSMSIQERTKEIGTMRAIGMKRRKLLFLLFTESAGIAAAAGGFALILSIPVALWLQYGGIDIQSAMPTEIPVPFGERFFAQFTPLHFVIGITVGTVSALAGSILPAVRASRLRIADAMGSAHVR